MSDTSVSDEDIQTVIDAGERYLEVDDHQGAYDLLHQWHESGHLGDRQGEVAFHLAEACMGLDALDAAMYYFEEASRDAPATLQQRAQERIAEIGRRDDAEEAVHEGVAGDDEAETVLRAADDALANNDFDTAFEYYTQAYDGIQMTEAQISRASVGLARCHAERGEPDEAEGYLQVAESNDASQLTGEIANIRTRLEEVRAGEAALEGGVDRSELDELNEAALGAAASRDWESAFRYFEQMYESGLLPESDRGRVAHNMGLTCLYTHDYDAAHQYLTESQSTSRPEVAERSTVLLAHLDDLDDAADIIPELDPDQDIYRED